MAKRNIRAYVDLAGCWVKADELAQTVIDALGQIKSLDGGSECDASPAEREVFIKAVRAKFASCKDL